MLNNAASRLGLFVYFSLLYWFIYSPPFKIFPVNSSLLLLVFALFLLFADLDFAKAFISWFGFEVLLLFLLSCYLLFLIIVGFDPKFGLTIAFSGFFVIFVSFFLAFYIRFWFFDEREVFRCLVLVSAFAALLAMTMFFNSDLTDYVRHNVVKFDFELNRYQLSRGFGISNELLFSFSVVQALALVLIFEYRLFGRIVRIVLTLILLASILINARIGLAVLFIYFGFKSIQLFLKKDFRLYIYFVLFFIAIGVALYLFKDKLNNLLVYQMVSFVSELGNFIGISSSTSAEGQLSTLFGRMFFLPEDTVGFLFGTGSNVFSGAGRNSDLGWIILANYGGVVLCFFITLWMLLISFYKHASNSLVVRLTVFFSFLIIMFKGLLWYSKPGFSMMVLILVVLRYYERRKVVVRV